MINKENSQKKKTFLNMKQNTKSTSLYYRKNVGLLALITHNESHHTLPTEKKHICLWKKESHQ